MGRNGITREPDIHAGSEWIHVNILKAKLNQADPRWLHQHPILNVYFGDSYQPQAVGLDQEPLSSEQKDEIIIQAAIQIEERLNFVKAKDPLLAHLYYELANLDHSLSEPDFFTDVISRWWGIKNNYNGHVLLDQAFQFGLKQDPIIQKRIKYLEASAWQRVWLRFLDQLGGWWDWIVGKN